MPENTLHVAGLILARGGSQGIPLKNICKLSSHPLLAWSVGAMRAFGRFDSIWVSTDHPMIAQCASSMGASVFQRSARYARCGTPSVDAVQEFLIQHPEVDIIGLVQCTSPFLQPEYLGRAYDLMTEEGFDSVFSVTRDKKLRWSESDFDPNKSALTRETEQSAKTIPPSQSDSSNCVSVTKSERTNGVILGSKIKLPTCIGERDAALRNIIAVENCDNDSCTTRDFGFTKNTESDIFNKTLDFENNKHNTSLNGYFNGGGNCKKNDCHKTDSFKNMKNTISKNMIPDFPSNNTIANKSEETVSVNGCLLNSANSDVTQTESTNEDVSISEAKSTVELVIKTAR